MKFIGKVAVVVLLIIVGIVLTKLGLVDKLVEAVRGLLNK